MSQATALIKAIVPWFGSKRTMAGVIVGELGPHKSYFELGCGSLAVLLAKPPSTQETACDLHDDLINLARIVADPVWCRQLYRRLQTVLFSDDTLDRARFYLTATPLVDLATTATPDDAVLWEGMCERARWWFVASWMARNGTAGMKRQDYQLAVRWTPNGGSPTTRWINAVETLPLWHQRLRHVVILRRDMFEVLPKISDQAGVAVYVDPPYLEDTRGGSIGYLHDFSEFDHRDLAEALQRFKEARVVVSYYDSPRLAELYPGWTKLDCARHKHLHVQNRRGAGTKLAPEVLLVNRPA